MTHWPVYIEYTGWYNACKVDDPEDLGIHWVKKVKQDRVTCPGCKKYLSEKKDI